MKNQFFGRAVAAVLLVLASLMIFSCRNDDSPKPPTNETIDKGHEEWSKVTFTFRKGHLHGSLFHGDPEVTGVNVLKPKQEISFVTDAQGNVKMESDAPLRLVKDEYYSLEINYFNKKGELINGEFVTPEMAPLHQHFFLSKDVKNIKTGEPVSNAENLAYTYRDTTPWNKNIKDEGVVLNPANNPVGLKGYFKVSAKYQTFDLNVILIHVIKGTKLNDDGTAYAFNNPSLRILGSQDLNLKIPARIFAERPATEEDLNTFITDIATEYKISYDEAEEALNKLWDANPEGGMFYL